MDATGVVLLVAFGGALVAAVASGSQRLHADLLDVEREERSFVRGLLRHPRLVRFIRQRLDRERFAGFTLTVAFLIMATTALLVGVVLDMVDGGGGIARYDDAVARWGVDHADGSAVRVLQRWTDLGSSTVLIPVILGVGLFYGLVRRRWQVLLFLATVGVGETLINSAVKHLVDRERPAIVHLTGFSGPSFPSGHSAAAAAIWSAVALVLTRDAGRRLRSFAAGMVMFVVLGVAASRALLGVHWLTDVVAGVALGWGWFVVCAVLFGGRRTRLGEPAERVDAASLGAAMHDVANARGPGAGCVWAVSELVVNGGRTMDQRTRGFAPVLDAEPASGRTTVAGHGGDSRAGPARPVADRGLRTWPFRMVSLKIWISAWAGMVVVTTLVGLLIVHVLDDGPVGRLDRSIAFWFADQRTPRWNSLAQIGAGLADAYTLTPAVIILVFVLAAVFRRWHESLVLAAGILLEKAVFLPSTYLVDRPRPPVTQLDGAPPTSSFPSGHVAAAVVCYGAVALIVMWHTRRRWLQALASLVAGLASMLVVVSRLELGMHHVTDVVWGAVAGAAALLVAVWAVRAGTDVLAAKGAPDRQGVLDPALARPAPRRARR